MFGDCLAKACDLVRKHLPHMMAAAANKKEKDLLDAFPKQAFDAVSIADFTQGWNLSSASSYASFAKDKPLDPAEFAAQLGVQGKKFKVPQFLLKGEQVERQCVTQLFTQIHNHDLYGEKIDNLDESIRSQGSLSSLQIKSLCKPSFHLLRHHLSKWFMYKSRIRSAIISDRNKPAVNKLLESNPFEAKIFPDSDVKELTNPGSYKYILPALGLQLSDNSQSSQEPPRKKLKHQHDIPSNTQVTRGQQQNYGAPVRGRSSGRQAPSGRSFPRSRRGRHPYRGRGNSRRPRPQEQSS